jgi:hypothetical protein
MDFGETASASDQAELDPRVAELLDRTARAKRMAAAMYTALRDRAPGATAVMALERVAADEGAHAAALNTLHRGLHDEAIPEAGGLAGCNPRSESWASGLMAAFALDQAATAALVALSLSAHSALGAAARSIIAEERDHETFALGAFKALVREDPSLGMPLAREMIVDRDWIKQVYPRKVHLVALVDAGLLPPEAPRQHDSFLASLGDRIQDALGVLGDL